MQREAALYCTLLLLLCSQVAGAQQNGICTCAHVSDFTPGAFVCTNRRDLCSRTLKAFLTDIVSHTAQAGGVIPHQDGILDFGRSATADLCNERQWYTCDEP